MDSKTMFTMGMIAEDNLRENKEITFFYKFKQI